MKSKIKILGIRADWKAFSFCLLAASIFWVLNAMNQEYTDDISYPIAIKYDKEKVIPVSPIPDQIRINVTGYGWDLLKKYIAFNIAPLKVEPNNLPERKYVSSSQITPYLTRQLPDINLNYILTDTLFFNFDYIKERKIKVEVDSQNIALVPSYKIITHIVADPDSIIFKGPASFISQLPDVIKISVLQTNIQSKFESNIKIPDQGYHSLVKMLNKKVKVSFDVAKFEKETIVITMKFLNFPSDVLKSTDKKTTLTYFIKEEDKNKIQQNDFEVHLDYNDLDKRDNTIGPRWVNKPAFVKDFYFTPYAVRIK